MESRMKLRLQFLSMFKKKFLIDSQATCCIYTTVLIKMEIGTESTGAVMDILLSGKPNQTNPNHTGLPTMDDILKTTWNF